MSTKKSRLDLNSSSSSFSNSPPSPILNTSSTSPFKGPFTGGPGPLRAGSSTSARYSPYSSSQRVAQRKSAPLVIRARREEEVVEQNLNLNLQQPVNLSAASSSSSSTQRIIQSLAAMSTPVLNAGRVRIRGDSLGGGFGGGFGIKPIKPSLNSSPFNNHYQPLKSSSNLLAPPKTTSPLLLFPKGNSNSSNKTLSLLPSRVLVESGTNTEEIAIESESKRKKKREEEAEEEEKVSKKVKTIPEVVVKEETFLELLEKIENLEKRKRKGGREFEFPSRGIELGEWVGLVRERGRVEEKGGGVKKEEGEEVKADDNRPKKWTCPTCMVQNNDAEPACVCCQEGKPGVAPVAVGAAGDKVDSLVKSPVVKNWSCPTCMVPNPPDASACVCCQEKNPNPIKGAVEDPKKIAPTTTSTPEYKFGIGGNSANLNNSGQGQSGFKFGVAVDPPKSSSSTGGGDFKFGVSDDIKTGIGGSVKFGFGGSAAPTAAASPSTFTFGFKPSSNTASTATTTPTKSPSFKFGVTQAEEDSATQKKPIQEKWQCGICQTKNEFVSFSCSMCASPKPAVFEGGRKSETGEEKSKKEVKFEPVFGKNAAGKGSSSSSSASPAGGGGSFVFGGGGFAGTEKKKETSFVFGQQPQTQPTPTPKEVAPPPPTFTPIPTVTITPAVPAATPTPAGQFTFGSSSSSTTTNNQQLTPTFQFGTATSPTAKRKLEEPVSAEENSTKKFNTSGGFGGGFSSPPAAAATATNNTSAGFLEHLKNASEALRAAQQQKKEVEPVGGAGGIGIVKDGGGGGFGGGSGSGLPAFSFGGGTTTFGAPPTAPTTNNNNPPPPPYTPNNNFNFGAPAAPSSFPAPASTSFNFAAAAATGPPATFNFGQTPQAQPQSQSQQQLPGLFQFSAAPQSNTATTPSGGRPMKRATRKLIRH